MALESQADALLWLLHALLRERWRPCDAPPDQNQRGEVAYEAPAAAEVRVRGLRVQQTLFVHFVSAATSSRLDLKLSEYVRAAESADTADADTSGRVVRVGSWLCNKETLRWRLERSVFAEFAWPSLAATNMEAELGKLAAPVLVRLLGFLRGPEFVRATQTNKASGGWWLYLHRLGDSSTLWHQFLEQDYPASTRSSNAPEALSAKAAYIAQHNRMRQREHHRRSRMLSPWARDSYEGGPWFLLPPPQPLQPPVLWVPPAPFQPLFPNDGRRDPRWGFDWDSHLWLPFERR